MNFIEILRNASWRAANSANEHGNSLQHSKLHEFNNIQLDNSKTFATYRCVKLFENSMCVMYCDGLCELFYAMCKFRCCFNYSYDSYDK